MGDIENYEVAYEYVTGADRVMNNVLSVYERASTAMSRASQIARDQAETAVPVDAHDDIASVCYKEIYMKRSPMIVLRRRPDYAVDHERRRIVRYVEVWSVNELM